MKKYVIAVLIFARLVMRYVLIVQTFVRIAKGVNTVWIFVKIASSPFLGVNSFEGTSSDCLYMPLPIYYLHSCSFEGSDKSWTSTK